MVELSYNDLRAAFMHLFLAGTDQDKIRSELKLSDSQYNGLRAFATDTERKRRHLARRSIREKEYRMKQPPSPDCAVVSRAKLTRSELLAHIESLLRINGVWASMKSYERCSNAKLVEVRDRLMRNRSDKYQYAETR